MAPRRETRNPLPSPSKIPRSRTMNVLSTIRSTFSRTNIEEDVVEKNELQGPYKSIQTSFSRADLRKDAMLGMGSSSPFEDITRNDHSPAGTPLKASETFSPDDFPLKRRSSPPIGLEDELDNPSHVRTAMPSEYWSGRFVGLHDQFHNELHEIQLDVISQMTADMYPNLFHEGAGAVNSEREQHTRALKVFIRLELACITQEARTSLRDWRREYAIKTKNAALLPMRYNTTDEAKMPGKGTSLRQSSAPFPPRSSSFSISAIKRKMASLGNEVVDFDEEDTLINHKTRKGSAPRVSSTRLPTPTFTKSTRSDRPITSQSPLPKDALGVISGFGRKTSVGYIPQAPTRDQDQGRRRDSSFGMTRDTSASRLSKPRFSLSRDTNVPPLPRSARPSPYHTQSAIDTSTQRLLGVDRDRSLSNISRNQIQPIRPSLLQERTNRDLNSYTEAKLKFNDIPRDASMQNIASSSNFEARRNQFSLPRGTSTQALISTSVPNNRRPSLVDSSSYNIKLQNFPSSNNNTEIQIKNRNLAHAPPALSRQKSLHSLNSSFPTQNGSRSRPRVSDGSSHSGNGVGPSITEEYEAPDDDIDVWNPRPKVKAKAKKPSLGRDNSILGFEESRSISATLYTDENIDELGSPQWDERGYPFYYFVGKRYPVPSKAPSDISVGGGASRVGLSGAVSLYDMREKRIITEERSDTWERLVAKREVRREKDRRMLQEGMEIERKVSGAECGEFDFDFF